MNLPAPIRWEDGRLWLLDQRRLPDRVTFEEQHDASQIARAIRNLHVRGAPAIGVAAAYGMAMAWRDGVDLEDAARELRAARPTAVNLAWAVDRMLAAATRQDDLIVEARRVHEEDRAMCEAIGRHGAKLIKPGSSVLTHCNAGALAVSHLGTATAPMYVAHEAGVRFHVYVDETRPVLQGSRLTSWELSQAGIDHTLICDSVAAHLMADGAVDLVIVGADRVTANGDTVNKIGTRALAIVAHYHDVPFYVACPSSTFDPTTAAGSEVAIEERPDAEVTDPIPAVTGVKVRNPAFDVTPAELVTAYVTERGVTGDIGEGLRRKSGCEP
ncbi:MAG: S-methyl-5-thioribose-1-phosphate isomerase [Gammaproteobacteria bacterium]|nr:S-methyl-5-thioribose-1-phosphate isomerase [Gammaproteobacteria bacterium]MYJ76174.1 S-methyl-5-thioribose-1-phosphate isomerase [Gammaproteobacteria bacterium]